jgi:endonuclease/exonuclease/phosphatase (EEP) superfamily protein YafD
MSFRPLTYSVFLGVGAFLIALWLSSRPSIPSEKSADEVVRIGTVNLGYQNAEPDAAAKALSQARADVLILQEWTGRNLSLARLRETGLKLLLSDERSGSHGSALLARSNLVLASRIATPPWKGNCAMPLLTARLRIGSQSVGIIAAHGPPPIATCSASRKPYLHAIVHRIHNGVLRQPVGVIPKGTSVLLVGDLNALAWEDPLRSMGKRGMADAFEAGSWRLGPTWSPVPWSPALVAIDHIWMPMEATSDAAWTLRVPGSDHRAVLADISFP